MSTYRSSSAHNQLLIAHIMSKMIFMKYLPPVRPKMVPKSKMLRIYWNFPTCDISNILISILLSKIIFIKYLRPAWPRFFPKLKMFKIYWNLAHSILMLKMIFIKYLPPARPKLAPKLKMLRIYWNLAHLIFRISPSRFWCQRLFLLNIYHLFSPNWS